jgi:serine/threonine protein phosphatase PrpC
MESFGLTDRGRVRNSNQDNILLNRELQLFIVADGMGGHACGEVASEMAVQTVNDHIHAHIGDGEQIREEDYFQFITNLLKESISQAHRAIYDYSQKLPGRETMGTTLSFLLFRKNKAYLAHIGDSRIYRLRAGQMEKLTKDYTEAQELADIGVISEADAENHRLSHVLTRVLGVPDRGEADTQVLNLVDGDRFLITSDGLFRVLDMPAVQAVLEMNLSVKGKCSSLLAQALEKGAPDNVSVIVVEL